MPEKHPGSPPRPANLTPSFFGLTGTLVEISAGNRVLMVTLLAERICSHIATKLSHCQDKFLSPNSIRRKPLMSI